MIPVRLKMENFLAYRSPKPLQFEGIHLACLTGMNGAGKSSLLDAITWALWGKARARSDDDLIYLTAKEARVELDFLHEGQTYRVVRQRQRGKTTRGALELFIHDPADNTYTDISEAKMKDTQKRIETLLRLDHETFVNSAFLQQGHADMFTTQTPANRKKILSKILGLAQWEAYEEQAKAERDRLAEQLRVIEGGIEELNKQIEGEAAYLRALDDARDAYARAQQTLSIAEAQLDEVRDAPVNLANAQRNRDEQVERLQHHKEDRTETEAKLAAQRGRAAEYQDVLEARADIEQGFSTLQTAREADQSLNSKLRDLRKLDDEANTFEREILGAKTELEAEARGLRKRITELKVAAEGGDDAELDTVQARLADLQSLDTKRNEARDTLSALKEESAGLKSENKALRVTMDELKERIETLSNVEGADCPLCGQPLTDDHRESMLAQLQTEGKSQGDTYRANVTRMEEIVAEIKATEARTAEMDDALADLSRLQKRAGELQAQQEAATQAQADLAETEARLENVQTTLDGESYAPEARARLAVLAEDRAALGYDESAHDEHREALDTYREYEDLKRRLDVAVESLDGVTELITGYEANVAKLTEAIAKDEATLAEMDEEIAALEAKMIVFEAREREVMQMRTEEREANNRVITAEQALAAVEAAKARKATLSERRDGLSEARGVYEDLRKAFGRNGVPAMIIETAIPELETLSNNLLLRMTDGRMTLKFSTQREKKSGEGVSETLDIDIADEIGTRNYEMYSGGEAFRIDFAIRVALSKLLARRAGAHLEVLFVDEGFGTQDADGRNKLIEAINAVKDDFDLILVITHIDDLKDAFPVHIVIDKTPQGSLIEVQ